ncbi:MAG: RNA polymerase factor sigma-54 [Nitrospira sp.]
MKLRLDLRLSQKLIMTPQLQQAIKLLQLSRLELQQTLSQHLMENPLLEELQVDAEEQGGIANEEGEQGQSQERDHAEASGASDSEKSEDTERPDEISQESWDNYFDSDRVAGGRETAASNQDELPPYEQTLAKPTSLAEYLLWQLALTEMPEAEKMIARNIIGNIDDDGYLQASVQDIAIDEKAPMEQVESVLRQVQSFDPAGVGARDLQECLLIQLGFLDHNQVGAQVKRNGTLKGSLVESIVRLHLKDLEKKQYARIAKALNTTVEAVAEATRVIEALEPKPGRPYFSATNFTTVPDVFVVKNEGEWVVALNDDGLPRLRISPYYKQMLGGSEKEDSEAAKVYLEEKYRGAQWLIRSIEQRNKTILKAVQSIVKFQEPFFERGVQYLKPLVLKQVAEDIGMHESTVSRVTANKYLYCGQGLLELKFFFNAALQRTDQSQEALSSVTVREMIRKMIAEENPQRPLKDEEIAARLQSHQIVIARRTVAKYRTEVNILSASQRKRFF